jgi:hypothetical protein
MRHVEHRKKWTKTDPGAGLFRRLALGALCGAFADFHETRRQRPLSVARLNGALAKKDAIAPDRDRADDRTRIDVMDLPAVVATIAFAIVSRRDPPQYRRTARGAEARIGRKHTASLQDEPAVSV